MDWTLVTAVGALVVSAISLYLAVAERVAAGRESDVKAALGNKESVAFVAQQLATGGWRAGALTGRLFPAERHHRRLLQSLCLAAVFEKSDRATALLFEGLRSYAESRRDGHALVDEQLESIDAVFRRYESLLSLKEGKSRERIERARSALTAP